MGPRFFKRGKTGGAVGDSVGEGAASMGPRFFKRGKLTATCYYTDDPAASMGPRFFKRGKQDTFAIAVDILRSFNGATLLQAWRVGG